MEYSGELNAEVFTSEIMNMLAKVQKVNGTFMPVFHNVVLSERNLEWKELYINLLKEHSNA